MDGPVKQKHFGVLLLHVCAHCSAIVCNHAEVKEGQERYEVIC